MQAEAGVGSSGDPGVPPLREAGEGAPAPVTGVPAVDTAIARLDELADLAVGEHPAVFERVHRELVEALGDLDRPEDAAPGPLPPRPLRPGPLPPRPLPPHPGR